MLNPEGRLTPREVSHVARRIATILLLEPALNDSYAAVKAGAYPWGGAGKAGTEGGG